jgi:hypothetical protein
MISPSLVLGFTLSTLYGLVFFLAVGHGWPRFFFYWIVGVVGFFAGQTIAHLVGLAIFNLGDLNLVEGTVVSWVGLVAARAWRP